MGVLVQRVRVNLGATTARSRRQTHRPLNSPDLPAPWPLSRDPFFPSIKSCRTIDSVQTGAVKLGVWTGVLKQSTVAAVVSPQSRAWTRRQTTVGVLGREQAVVRAPHIPKADP